MKFVEDVTECNNKARLETKQTYHNYNSDNIGKQFNDANNTVYSVTDVTSMVPSYTLFDLSFQWKKLQCISGYEIVKSNLHLLISEKLPLKNGWLFLLRQNR